jgi:hypothetical protein
VLGVGLLQSDTANFPYAEPFFDAPECSFYHPTGFDDKFIKEHMPGSQRTITDGFMH